MLVMALLVLVVVVDMPLGTVQRLLGGSDIEREWVEGVRVEGCGFILVREAGAGGASGAGGGGLVHVIQVTV